MQRQTAIDRFHVRGATVDLRNRLIRVQGAPHRTRHLSALEGAVLGYLAHRAGQAVSREALLLEVWGYPRVPRTTRAVDNVVRRLRAKLDDDSRSPAVLFTIHGEGYLLRIQGVTVQALVTRFPPDTRRRAADFLRRIAVGPADPGVRELIDDLAHILTVDS